MAKRKSDVAVEENGEDTGIQFSQTLRLNKRGVEKILTAWAKNRKMPVGPDGVVLEIDAADDAVIATIEAGYKPLALRTRNRGEKPTE